MVKSEIQEAEVKEIEFSDLVLVAFLMMKEFEISKPPFTVHKHTHFTFRHTPEIQKAYQDFLNGHLDVDLTVFLNTYNKVKGIANDLRGMAKKLGHDVGGEQDE